MKQLIDYIGEEYWRDFSDAKNTPSDDPQAAIKWENFIKKYPNGVPKMTPNEQETNPNNQ